MSETGKLLVIERNGICYALDRPAYKGDDGTYDLAQLRPDEILLSPGVIYRAVPLDGTTP